MSEFFDAINKRNQQFKENLIKSFGYEEEGDMEKSHVINTLGHQFSINKSGKLIKEKLLDMLEAEKSDHATYFTNLTILRSQIEDAPLGDFKEMYYYKIDGFEDKIGTMPGQPYAYNQCYNCSGELSDKETEGSSATDNKKTSYNDNLLKWVDSKIEMLMLETMINNFEDSKVYPLTVEQATMIGF